MEKKQPLSVSNIPRPSRLPQPSTRKRPIADVAESCAKENGPPSKRPNMQAPKKTTVAKASSTRSVPISRAPARKAVVRPLKPATVTAAGATKRARIQPGDSKVATQPKKAGGSEGTITHLQSQLDSLASRMCRLEQEKVQQEGVASSRIKALEEELSSAARKLTDTEHRLEAVEHSKAAVQRAHDAVEAELRAARQESASLKATVSQMAADASAIHCQLEAVKATRDQALSESRHKSELISQLEGEREALHRTIEECQQRIREDESHRRKLHNTIQELKGNIRVFCRVRPVLPSEGASAMDDSTSSSDSSSSASSLGSLRRDKGSLCIDYPDKGRDSQKVVLQFTPREGDKSSRSNQYQFEFDQVFSPDCTQETVFGEISQLVQSALDGYNVCIFAYGQTGSGKTYTMEGPSSSDEDERGMIPRALEQVFSTTESLQAKGWSYKMEACFIEIYNETLRDLLSSSSKEEKHEIRIDSKNQGEVYVTNLTPVAITSRSQIARLLEVAAKNRSVAATLCNDRSSRSHCVFRLTLCGSNSKTKETCRGSLNLVDLAGSERLSQSGSVGDRLKETKSINKSLSNLGNVIMALANKDQHIPYRNSKLTYLLQNSLGGNSKTLMFVNMSPLPGALQETLCSLRFATKVNQCNIGTARKLAK